MIRPAPGALLAAAAVTCLLLAGCGGGETVPGGQTLRTGEIRIPAKLTGSCALDYRAAVSKVAPDGRAGWSTDVPWADGMPQPVVTDGAVTQATWN